MVLHKTPKGNVFVSHRSGAVLPAERSCAVCGGWNLVSLGIGVDRVADEIKKKLGRAELFVFTADTVATHKAATRLMEAFLGTPGAVMVGTERMLPYAPRVALSVVASIDSVLSLPSWRAHEHALQTLYALLAKSDERLIVETRKPDAAVLKSLATGSPIEFLREETKERKFYGYPPYSLFIGLTWHGSEVQCTETARLVGEELAQYDLVGPLPPELVARNVYRQRAVVRREPGTWPDEELLAKLKSLPPVTVTVDPDDIV
jgi:primosomal protein N' (replication factor Y)